MFYNYKKIFFCCQIRTQTSFWRYLFFTALMILPTTILSTDNNSRIPKKTPAWNFNEYIKAQYTSQSEAIGRSYISHLKFGKNSKAIIPAKQPIKKKKNTNFAQPIVEATSPKNPPLKKYHQTKQAYNENIQNLQANNDRQIHISQPNFTDFAVIQGYRSYEETVAVGSKSKKVIQRCLERYFRYHPRIRGKIIVKFDVHPDGYIIDESLEIVYSDIAYQPTLEAIRKSMLRWVSYPAVPLESGIYSVTQKYIF